MKLLKLLKDWITSKKELIRQRDRLKKTFTEVLAELIQERRNKGIVEAKNRALMFEMAETKQIIVIQDRYYDLLEEQIAEPNVSIELNKKAQELKATIKLLKKI